MRGVPGSILGSGVDFSEPLLQWRPTWGLPGMLKHLEITPQVNLYTQWKFEDEFQFGGGVCNPAMVELVPRLYYLAIELAFMATW